MKVALVRVGVDSKSGGIQGPLFQDGSFEYIPIPDDFGVDERTYGNTRGSKGKHLVEYFPRSYQNRMTEKSLHFDPEFETFTYGDPTRPKAGLARLKKDDLLVFYCGLEGFDHSSQPALYLFGYFVVEIAGKATEMLPEIVRREFRNNFHVRHEQIFEEHKHKLVLVKGGSGSRFLKHAIRISSMGKDRRGRPLKIISLEMQKIFGDFGGKVSIQRSPTRWVAQKFIATAAEFIRSIG